MPQRVDKKLEAVVLAGGLGSRLLPQTSELPKPLVKIGDRPVIEYLLYQLKKGGVGKVYMAVNHLAYMIEECLGDGSRFGLELVYSVEDEPLSTVGPLRLLEGLPENFVVANGDVLFDLDIAALFQAHCQSDADLTVAAYQRKEQIDYGVLESNAERLVTGFSEKPSYSFEVSMGVYVFKRAILKCVPPNRPYGFDQLVLKLLSEHRPVATYPFAGYWLDIGRPADYARAQRDIDIIRSLLPQE